jgi:hypothetical protein
MESSVNDQLYEIWKIVCSIPDDIIGFFLWLDPSGSTIALG